MWSTRKASSSPCRQPGARGGCRSLSSRRFLLIRKASNRTRPRYPLSNPVHAEARAASKVKKSTGASQRRGALWRHGPHRLLRRQNRGTWSPTGCRTFLSVSPPSSFPAAMRAWKAPPGWPGAGRDAPRQGPTGPFVRSPTAQPCRSSRTARDATTSRVRSKGSSACLSKNSSVSTISRTRLPGGLEHLFLHAVMPGGRFPVDKPCRPSPMVIGGAKDINGVVYRALAAGDAEKSSRCRENGVRGTSLG